jgi:hypothetical protein
MIGIQFGAGGLSPLALGAAGGAPASDPRHSFDAAAGRSIPKATRFDTRTGGRVAAFEPPSLPTLAAGSHSESHPRADAAKTPRALRQLAGRACGTNRRHRPSAGYTPFRPARVARDAGVTCVDVSSLKLARLACGSAAPAGSFS